MFLPMCVSYVSLPILAIIGGAALGAYGTDNKVIDTFVTIFWLLIPFGVVVSIFCIPFLFMLGKIREALYLFLCISLFIIYFLLCPCVVEFFGSRSNSLEAQEKDLTCFKNSQL